MPCRSSEASPRGSLPESCRSRAATPGQHRRCGDRPSAYDEFTSAVKELGEGCFAAGRVLHANELDGVISLARTYTGELEALRDKAADAELRTGARGATDTGERPSGLPGMRPENLVARTFGPAETQLDNADPAGDLPPHERTKDAMTTRSLLFGSGRTQDYAAGLKKGREPQSVTAPAKVATAADYSRNLAAGRAARR